MDGLTFYKLIRILKEKLIKSKLNKLTLQKDSVFLSFYKDDVINLEYRAAPAPPLLHPVSSIFGESPGALSSIHGSVVTDINTYGYERAAYIEVKKRKPSGKVTAYKLILEPAGNYANFLLINEENIILYSLSSRTIDPDRNIGAGGTYNLPKANKQYSLNNLGRAVSFNDLSGFYPVTAKYADMLLKDYSIEKAAGIIKDSLNNDDNFYIDSKNKVIPFYIDNAKTVKYNELSSYYSVKNNVQDNNVSKCIKKIFTARLDKYIELASKLEKELINAKQYPNILLEAELIKNNLYKVHSAGKYIFEKYTDKGIEEVEYIVNPSDNLHEKADKLFKKANRLKKSIPLIEDRMQDTMQLALSAKEQIYYSDTLSQDELIEFHKILEDDKKPLKKGKKDQSKPFLEYIGEGYRFYIGKNSASNHELVFKFAQSSDIWFHGRNIPSSHGILRLEGIELQNHIIDQVAKVVAYYSKYGSEKLIDIDYTYKKYVTKPKNTPVGFVIYKRFKTITVTPFSKEEIKDMNLLKENF